MKFKKVICLLLCITILSGIMMTSCSKRETGKMTLENGYTTENLSLYEVPEWFRDAKFGIFIHYGVYSVPAYGDEWYGHQMYIPDSLTYGGDNIYDYHSKVYGGASKFGYKDFIPQFNDELKKFDKNNMAKEWADLFEQAGAKYVMPVGIHHDSFALYDSDIQTTYNSVNQAGVDYIAELQEALKDKDIKFGISNHFVENDWFFDDAYGEGTDLGEKNADGSLVYGELYGDGESKSEAHIHKWFDISMEIINKYHPDIIYYDFDLGNENLDKYEDANRYLMLANYYNQALKNNPNGVVCCNKLGAFTQAEAMLDKERSSLSDIAPTPWQTDTSVGKKSWGYVTNEEYRTGEQFIGALVDIVSKNGNLLLNVGPKADGTIPSEAKNALLTIGKWLGKYGDAIYKTRPWYISGEGPTSATDDSFTYQEGDIRFTKNKDNLNFYITSLAGISGDTLSVKTLRSGNYDASHINSISLLDGSNREQLEWEQKDDALEIKIPEKVKNEPFSLEVDVKVDLDYAPQPAIPADKTVNIDDTVDVGYGITLGHSTVDGSPTAIAGDGGSRIERIISFDNFDPAKIWFEVSGDSKGTITVNSGDVATLKVKPDSKNAYRIVSAETLGIDKDTNREISITFSKGIELSAFGFYEKRNANQLIDASKFDESQGAVKAEPTADTEYEGDSLGYVSWGDWVLYRNVDFGENATKLVLRTGADNKSFRVYADKMKKGNIIAEGTISTGGYNDYQTLEFDLNKKLTGSHDIYIEFVDDAINLNFFAVGDDNFKLK